MRSSLFLVTYTSGFNRRHRVVGHLFSGRYKALPVDGSENGYLRTARDYVHLNPEGAKLLRRQDSLRQYPGAAMGNKGAAAASQVDQGRPAFGRDEDTPGQCRDD